MPHPVEWVPLRTQGFRAVLWSLTSSPIFATITTTTTTTTTTHTTTNCA